MMTNAIKKTMLSTGISIILMTVLAGFVMTVAFNDLLNPKSDSVPSYFQYLAAVLGWVAILICDLIVSHGVFHLFKTQNIKKARLSSLLRYFYSFLLAIGIFFLLKGLLSYDSKNQLRENVAFFKWIWSFGLIIFGFHLTTLSKLFCEKDIIRRLISILLLTAGIGYILIHGTAIVIPEYSQSVSILEPYFIPSMLLGELGFAIWLIAKGIKKRSAIFL